MNKTVASVQLNADDVINPLFAEYVKTTTTEYIMLQIGSSKSRRAYLVPKQAKQLAGFINEHIKEPKS